MIRRALLLAGLAACHAEPTAPGPPYRARVITLASLDPATEGADYALSVEELPTLIDLDTLQGDGLRVFRGGELLIEEVAGSIVVGRFEDSEAALLRYDVEDGVIVPRDYPTLVMLSAFHAFEQVTAAFPRVTGAALAELRERPQLEIFFEPVFRFAGDIEITSTDKFNAFYMPGTEQFGLAQRSDLESAPLASSIVVISHETGHFLFDKSFARGETCDADADNEGKLFPGRLDREYALSGINEGFGDFVAFAVTGTTSPLEVFEDRFPDLTVERSLTRSAFRYDDLALEEPPCEGAFYCIGTLFARSLVEVMPALGLDPQNPDHRGELSRQVFAALDGARGRLELDPSRLPDPRSIVKGCERAETIALDHDGRILGAFFHAFVAALPAATRGPLCARLVAHFGDNGFPAPVRDTCPAGSVP